MVRWSVEMTFSLFLGTGLPDLTFLVIVCPPPVTE